VDGAELTLDVRGEARACDPVGQVGAHGDRVATELVGQVVGTAGVERVGKREASTLGRERTRHGCADSSACPRDERYAAREGVPLTGHEAASPSSTVSTTRSAQPVI